MSCNTKHEIEIRIIIILLAIVYDHQFKMYIQEKVQSSERDRVIKEKKEREKRGREKRERERERERDERDTRSANTLTHQRDAAIVSAHRLREPLYHPFGIIFDADVMFHSCQMRVSLCQQRVSFVGDLFTTISCRL